MSNITVGGSYNFFGTNQWIFDLGIVYDDCSPTSKSNLRAQLKLN